MTPWPSYVQALGTGLLASRAKAAWERLSTCDLCPRQCGADRLAGELGFCQAGAEAVISSAGPHFGEEEPLVGRRGSGTIFFTHCNLRCLFCQNEDISLRGEGRVISLDDLAQVMLELQDLGCHNVNLVTPTHQTPQILAALVKAAARGLRIPLVYNCGGYESLDTLALLDGVVDIYMPDFKFGRSAPAALYAQAPDYPEKARAALTEMHRQVGDLVIDEAGLARRGLLVRHLVLPQDLAGTAEVVEFLARLSPDTYLNVMDQYRPCAQAGRFPELARRPRPEEVQAAVDLALRAGLKRLDRPRRILRFF